MKFVLSGKIDKFWTYREASIPYRYTRMEIECDDDMIKTVSDFLESNEYALDDNICWKVGNIYYHLGGRLLIIGDGIREDFTEY